MPDVDAERLVRVVKMLERLDNATIARVIIAIEEAIQDRDTVAEVVRAIDRITPRKKA